MKLTIYQIDAFAEKLFTGNPAAVIPLETWIDDQLMQQIAMENNLAETVFFVPNGDDFDIRWFTPASEINLCGHATLASAYVLYHYLGYTRASIVFHSMSGPLTVTRQGDMFQMDFPAWVPERITDHLASLETILGIKEVVGVYKHRDMIVELQSEKDVKAASPDFTLMKKTGHNYIITAPGSDVDFVSRFFAPKIGIDEDPVTGSSHSQLIPLWYHKLQKQKMTARQLSPRGGQLWVEHHGERVMMGGRCIFYMKGEITIGDD